MGQSRRPFGHFAVTGSGNTLRGGVRAGVTEEGGEGGKIYDELGITCCLFCATQLFRRGLSCFACVWGFISTLFWMTLKQITMLRGVRVLVVSLLLTWLPWSVAGSQPLPPVPQRSTDTSHWPILKATWGKSSRVHIHRPERVAQHPELSIQSSHTESEAPQVGWRCCEESTQPPQWIPPTYPPRPHESKASVMWTLLNARMSLLKAKRTQLNATKSRLKAKRSRLRARKIRLKAKWLDFHAPGSRLNLSESQWKTRRARLKGQRSRLKARWSQMRAKRLHLKAKRSYFRAQWSRLQGKWWHWKSRSRSRRSRPKRSHRSVRSSEPTSSGPSSTEKISHLLEPTASSQQKTERYLLKIPTLPPRWNRTSVLTTHQTRRVGRTRRSQGKVQSSLVTDPNQSGQTVKGPGGVVTRGGNRDLYIVGLFPFSGRLGAIGEGVRPAVDLAIRHINNDSTLLPGITLHVHFNDTKVWQSRGRQRSRTRWTSSVTDRPGRWRLSGTPFVQHLQGRPPLAGTVENL